MTEPPKNPKENREKMSQIIFETFNAPGLYISITSILSLYAAGNLDGTVVDLGDGVTNCLSVFDGSSLPYSIIRLDFGGRDLTQYMEKLLYQTGYRASTTSEKEIVKAIKEKACYVAMDFNDEIRTSEPFDYELPDGNHIIIKDQRIICTEALFKPEKINKVNYGIQQACCDSIQKCDCDIRRNLYNTIILSGGTSMFQGLKERFEKEIRHLAPLSMEEEVRVIASPDRKFYSWIGGSILSSISSFESSWITKTEYEECGATIVHRKCF